MPSGGEHNKHKLRRHFQDRRIAKMLAPVVVVGAGVAIDQKASLLGAVRVITDWDNDDRNEPPTTGPGGTEVGDTTSGGGDVHEFVAHNEYTLIAVGLVALYFIASLAMQPRQSSQATA